jgi:quinol monooxygenase YgiN
MVSRIITCSVDPTKVDDFKVALNEHFLPRIQALPGFLENIESLDPATGKFCCVTVWKSPEDVANYDNGLFQEVAAAMVPLMKDGPKVETLPVENSSVHHVKAGRAAA